MSTRAALVLLLMLATGPVVAAAADAGPPAGLAELMALLAARRQGHVSFTEVHQMAMLKEPLRSSGELVYEAPDHLEKRTMTPRVESLVLDHGVLTAQRGAHRHVLTLADYPQVVPFVESIRATLAGDRAALERYFTVSFEGNLERWTLQLTPKDAAVARSVRQVRIRGERDAIQDVEIRQSDGDRSLVTIGPDVTP